MRPKIQLAGRIALFEIGAAALVAVVALSIPKLRPVKGFEQIALDRQQKQREQHGLWAGYRWADYRPLVLRSGAVILVTSAALLVGLRTRRP